MANLKKPRVLQQPCDTGPRSIDHRARDAPVVLNDVVLKDAAASRREALLLTLRKRSSRAKPFGYRETAPQARPAGAERA
jgi:hypothetical protein